MMTHSSATMPTSTSAMCSGAWMSMTSISLGGSTGAFSGPPRIFGPVPKTSAASTSAPALGMWYRSARSSRYVQWSAPGHFTLSSLYCSAEINGSAPKRLATGSLLCYSGIESFGLADTAWALARPANECCSSADDQEEGSHDLGRLDVQQPVQPLQLWGDTDVDVLPLVGLSQAESARQSASVLLPIRG